MVEEANYLERAKREELFVNPRYDVRRDDKVYYIDVYVPGVSKGDSTVTLEGDTLMIEAIRKSNKEDSWKALYREIPERSYKLHLQLNIDIEAEAIGATLEAGVLTVSLPVAEKAAKRMIPISQ